MAIGTAPAFVNDPAFAEERHASGGPATDAVRRERVLARLADNPHLPSPPGIVLQVLERASRLDCSPTELAAVIHRDPALCGKILKAVNSALYGLPRSITSIERAVVLLGLKPVRSLVLSLSLPAMQQSAASPPTESFWKESVAGAIVAHELAIYLRRPCREEDLVAGLLRDVGTLALQQVCPQEYAQLLAEPAEERIRNPCRLERQLLGVDHADVSAFLLERWRLPEDVTEAVRHHHSPEQTDELPRAAAERVRLLYFASRIAQLQLGAAQPELLSDVLAFGREHYGMNEAALTAFLEPLAQKIEEFAALMDLDIGSCAHYPRILARAAEELVQLTLETSVDKLRILEQKRQAEQETQLWRQQAHRLRDEVVRDPLTDAFNRGCLEEELRLTFRRACRRGTVLGLIFLDLDDFKGLNDRFGHLFGDQVLKDTATSLFNAVRPSDVVARYGGDEFCVVVENTSRESLRAMAERLWHSFNNRVIESTDHTASIRASIRASIGAVLCLPRTFTRPATELLQVADRAMYAAKSTGKNQITIISLLTEDELRFLGRVERRQFSAWLTTTGREKGSQVRDGMRRLSPRFTAPGRRARQLDWLTAAQLRPVLREQRVTRRRFDEIVRERGLLTADQLSILLALQLEPPETVAANLVNQGICSETVMQENLRSYYQWLRTPLHLPG